MPSPKPVKNKTNFGPYKNRMTITSNQKVRRDSFGRGDEKEEYGDVSPRQRMDDQ